MTFHNNNRNPQSRVRVRAYDPNAFILRSAPAPNSEPTHEEDRIEREQQQEFRHFLLAIIRRVVEILAGDGEAAMYVLSERGESLREIAERFDCSHETVRRKLRQIKRYFE